MSWDTIIGHKSQIEFLKNAQSSKRVAHAYLFVGPRGIGKHLAALTFAKALCCENEGAACERCESCKMVESGVHPDIRVTQSDERSGAVKIEQIRGIQDRVSLASSQGKFKVEIVLGAGAMTAEAQNAFLKVLEEPPKDTVLILVADNIEALFSTIRSRCWVVKFAAMGISVVEEILKRDYAAADEAAHFLATMSGGRLGEAISLLSSDIIERRDDILSGRWDLVEEDQKTLEILCGIYRDALMSKVNAHRALLVNADKPAEIEKLTRSNSLDAIIKILEEIERSSLYLKQNVSPKLVFMPLQERLKRMKSLATLGK